jgi:hypothetical protein
MASEWHFVRRVGSAVPFCGEKSPQHATDNWLYVTCLACRVAALNAEKVGSPVTPAPRPRAGRRRGGWAGY